MESITNLGANIAILTAKHGCGFTLWPTKAKLPDGGNYGYDVGVPGAFGRDVLQEFVDSANQAGVGYGFYYVSLFDHRAHLCTCAEITCWIALPES